MKSYGLYYVYLRGPLHHVPVGAARRTKKGLIVVPYHDSTADQLRKVFKLEALDVDTVITAKDEDKYVIRIAVEFGQKYFL